MRVSQLWTYPVKSMIGVETDSVSLSQLGIVGDRHWAVRDNERGGIRGAKKIGELMQFSARPAGDGSAHVIITLPNGEEVRSDNTQVDAVLSDTLGRSVSLESLPADGALEHFRRGPSDSTDVMAELRGVFGRTDDEPLPDFSVFPPEITEFESPPGTHHDCWPLMVMTTSALDALRNALPESVIDILRFRPSLVVETPNETGHPEFSWKGRTGQLGSAVVEFLDPCPRCVMITRRVTEDIPEDRAIMRHVVRELNQAVGVYARIVTPGKVSLGDTLTFL
ncbi:MAG: MOSC N-terminal beta barrel domain-containing protein [Actinobacteria bacterium]|nr:MOSC N-terminal beta barrel domain-containing protein [Actinomycetota bacterium]